MNDIARVVRERGYEPLAGGMTNHLFVHRRRGEVLRLAVTSDPEVRGWKTQDFARCRAASPLFASCGLMPEVLDAGDDWGGTGCPYLVERFVSGRNLSEAYADAPDFWDERLPGEIVRIYQGLLEAGSPLEEAAGFWQDKLAWLDELNDSPHFTRFADLHAVCRAAVLSLAERELPCPHLHGDLQLANLLVVDARAGRLLLIDWELTQRLPLAFEFAHFYQNLYDPVPQTVDALRPYYERARPLKRLWENLAPRLAAEFGVGGETFRRAVIIHRSGWLRPLDGALRAGDDEQAVHWERKLRAVVDGATFDVLPAPPEV